MKEDLRCLPPDTYAKFVVSLGYYNRVFISKLFVNPSEVSLLVLFAPFLELRVSQSIVYTVVGGLV